MPQKVVLVADPGIDTSFAVALALLDPRLDVVGLLASAGNVPPEQATQNVHILIDQLDPPKWPRLGAAPPVEYESDGLAQHGPGGLGGVPFPAVTLHSPHPSDKLLCELVRQYPREITLVVLGPLTVVARALDRDADLPSLLGRVVCVGGVWREAGNASPVAEFHFALDPEAARQVLRCGAPITVIPLDVTRKLIFSPSDLLELPAPESSACRFLRQIVPYGIRASSNLYGVEGFHMKDVLGVAALGVPEAFSVRPYHADVEPRGELTRGMLVVDARPSPAEPSNIDLVVNLDVPEVREYIRLTLARAGQGVT